MVSIPTTPKYRTRTHRHESCHVVLRTRQSHSLGKRATGLPSFDDQKACRRPLPMSAQPSSQISQTCAEYQTTSQPPLSFVEDAQKAVCARSDGCVGQQWLVRSECASKSQRTCLSCWIRSQGPQSEFWTAIEPKLYRGMEYGTLELFLAVGTTTPHPTRLP